MSFALHLSLQLPATWEQVVSHSRDLSLSVVPEIASIVDKNFLDVLWLFFVSIGPGELGNGRLKVRRRYEHSEPALLL